LNQPVAVGAAIPLRGDMMLTRKTDLMEALHNAQFRASAAAAGCTVAKPEPDDGIDWVVSHRSRNHTIGRSANIEVQLRSTSQIAPPFGNNFPFRLDSNTFDRLIEESHFPRILIVCVLPSDIDQWIYADRPGDTFQLRHLSYWYNVKTAYLAGDKRTTLRIPTVQVFDDLALCDIMRRVGEGGVP
jgi:hypothetical protein